MTDNPMDRATDRPDHALDALLRQYARPVPGAARSELESRILAQAAFPLAARRRAARLGVADTLAAWVRVALPLAAAAAIAAVLFLSRIDTGALADAELHDSDPAALLSALESDDGSGLAHHVIASDAVSGGAVEPEPR
jgi:anti-sigma-K factor RskA